MNQFRSPSSCPSSAFNTAWFKRWFASPFPSLRCSSETINCSLDQPYLVFSCLGQPPENWWRTQQNNLGVIQVSIQESCDNIRERAHPFAYDRPNCFRWDVTRAKFSDLHRLNRSRSFRKLPDELLNGVLSSFKLTGATFLSGPVNTSFDGNVFGSGSPGLKPSPSEKTRAALSSSQPAASVKALASTLYASLSVSRDHTVNPDPAEDLFVLVVSTLATYACLESVNFIPFFHRQDITFWGWLPFDVACRRRPNLLVRLRIQVNLPFLPRNVQKVSDY